MDVGNGSIYLITSSIVLILYLTSFRSQNKNSIIDRSSVMHIARSEAHNIGLIFLSFSVISLISIEEHSRFMRARDFYSLNTVKAH
ncbi:hypothetical protein GGU10DRAFT_354978 [Lentinula aff. detonsa]|uniref:Uncharacterized protein n=1 Tax=Lentinula aff. detonsa TaxID=2804958 RepID=A0AA38KG86_9AGAR|nr:hypothetical protein GGU10DRAFT_354978 [Lentinula aff. detonsa]